MQNVEYKAELRDIALARSICRVIGAEPMGALMQTDTYYHAADARFKKRETAGEPTVYIVYHRRDRTSPKISRFEILSEEGARERFGEREHAPMVVVRKRRELFILRNVRIHLDRVEELGEFLEFEAAVSPKWNLRRCHDSLRKLRTQFMPALGEAVSCGYADLIASGKGA